MNASLTRIQMEGTGAQQKSIHILKNMLKVKKNGDFVKIYVPQLGLLKVNNQMPLSRSQIHNLFIKDLFIFS